MIKHLSLNGASMGLSRTLAAAGGALVLCGAGAATASIVTLTYTGSISQVYYSHDDTGVFGPPDTPLTGSFTAKFVFDTRQASDYVDNDPDFPGYGSEARGRGPNSPSLGAWLTINGVTVAFAGAYGDVSTSNYGGYVDHPAYVSDRVDGRDGDGLGVVAEDQLGLTVQGYGVPYGLNTNLDFDLPQDGDQQGSFYIDQYLYQPYYGGIESLRQVSAFGDLVPTHFTQTVVDVPEPATWSMMLIGFGAIGLTLRRRKSAVSVS